MGKEFYKNGSLKFDGDYLNGKRWNGKIYNEKFDSIYELKNGRGFIKEYYDNNELNFEGYYINGVKHGKGKEYYDNGKLQFEGEYFVEKNGLGKDMTKIKQLYMNLKMILNQLKNIMMEVN